MKLIIVMTEFKDLFTTNEIWQWQLMLLAATLMLVIHRVYIRHAKDHVGHPNLNAISKSLIQAG